MAEASANAALDVMSVTSLARLSSGVQAVRVMCTARDPETGKPLSPRHISMNFALGRPNLLQSPRSKVDAGSRGRNATVRLQGIRPHLESFRKEAFLRKTWHGWEHGLLWHCHVHVDFSPFRTP